MQFFTNKFSAATNLAKDEVMIKFYQESPVFSPDTGNEAGNEAPTLAIENVSNLVMTGNCAKNLIEVLQRLLSDETLPETNKPQE